eukprot:NODE_6411_length_512_cov_138.077754_g5636_i0.p1 GENE.NODE_6411_length_512_cov_138.077754_g5636_i0~~NODE_6411_length_512_cov_138.077754_g5636_i0.p1  ORF type:complete len:119 (-),score=16.41 NODE_6411_length_512_cov_138.077754_g5636_i0:100-456(-)
MVPKMKRVGAFGTKIPQWLARYGKSPKWLAKEKRKAIAKKRYIQKTFETRPKIPERLVAIHFKQQHAERRQIRFTGKRVKYNTPKSTTKVRKERRLKKQRDTAKMIRRLKEQGLRVCL